MTPITTAETPIALSDAPDYLPKRSGKKVHYSTVYRWATRGARGRVLETQLVGGVRYTTLGALNRFLNSPIVTFDDRSQSEAIRQALYGDD